MCLGQIICCFCLIIFTASSIAFPACVINGTAVTKTFQILYRNEEVRLGDIAHFRIHAIVEGGKVTTFLQ